MLLNKPLPTSYIANQKSHPLEWSQLDVPLQLSLDNLISSLLLNQSVFLFTPLKVLHLPQA